MTSRRPARRGRTYAIYGKSRLNLTGGEVVRRAVELHLSNPPRLPVCLSCTPWSRSNSTSSYFMAALPYSLRRRRRGCCLIPQVYPPESGMLTVKASNATPANTNLFTKRVYLTTKWMLIFTRVRSLPGSLYAARFSRSYLKSQPWNVGN